MSTYSYALYAGKGADRTYPVPFPYLNQKHVKVSIDSVPTDVVWVSPGMVEVPVNVPQTSVVEVKRVTVQDTPPADFNDGSIIRELDLDTVVMFAMYAAQEALDAQMRSVYQLPDGNFTAQGFRITNVADPVNPHDVATRGWIDTQFAQQLTQMAAQYTAALQAAAAAKASEVAAEDSEIAAEEAADVAVEASKLVREYATSLPVQVVAADLGGNLLANRDLGKITDPSTSPETTAPKGYVQTIAENMEDVQQLAQNMQAILTAAQSTLATLTQVQQAATAAANAAAASHDDSLAADASALDAHSSELSAASSKTAAASSKTGADSAMSQAQSFRDVAASYATATSAAADAAVSARAAAEVARDQALAAFENFSDRYLGEGDTDPLTDNDGEPLVVGALYFNTTGSGTMKVYKGTGWASAYASLDGAVLTANNLSDLTNPVAARTNLGLGALATKSTVAAADIPSKTLTASHLADKTVTATQIADTTISAAKLVSKTITAAQIADDTITATQIAAGAVSISELATTLNLGTLT